MKFVPKMLKTLVHGYSHILKEGLKNEVLFYKKSIFRVSDSMNDFNLINFFGFAIKSYIDSEIPRP